MRRASMLATGLLAVGAAGTTPETASTAPRVTCTSGQTLYLQHGVRVFQVLRREPGALDGRAWVDFACRGTRGTPSRMGEHYTDDRNQGEVHARAYAFSGGRYIGFSNDYNGGEACGDHGYVVRGVRSARFLHAIEGDCAFQEETDSDDLVTTPRGGLAYLDNGTVFAFRPPRGSRSRRVSTMGTASDLAARADRVYWTETAADGGPLARSRDFGPDASGPEAQTFEYQNPVRRTGRCARGGTTLGRTVLVRVVDRGGRRSACRVTRDAGPSLPGGDLRDLQIAADRWVLAVGTEEASVVDLVGGTRRRVGGTLREWTLLDDGTLAWVDAAGALHAQTPDARTPTPVAAAATAIAGRGATLYWTGSDGAPARIRPAGALGRAADR